MMAAMRGLFVVLVVSALAACSRGGGLAPADAATPDAGGGPRLVAWQVRAEDTPPLVVGIYDAQEKVHCRFLHDEAGQLRCLPWGLSPLTDTGTFSDPTCQQRVYQADSPRGISPGRPVALPLPRLDCEPQRYAVGTLRVLPGGATLYAGTPCAPVGEAGEASTDGTVDVAVEEVPPERWATGAEVDGPLVAGRLRVRQIAAADGTRFGDHLVDETFGKACVLGKGPTCWPTLLPVEAGVEGADCMSTVKVWRSEACADPAAISMGDSWFALGPIWTGPVSIKYHGCTPVSLDSPSGPYTFYELGAPLVDATPARAEWQGEGSGRFRLRGLRGPAGETVLLDNEIAGPNGWITARYFDTVANVDCDPRWTPEGLVRCVPTNVIVGPGNAGLVAFFSDAACQTPVLACPGLDKPCGDTPVISTATDADGELRDVSLNAAVDLATVYGTAPDGSCAPTPAPFHFFTLGAPLPWDSYPALTEINGRASGAP
jgi:hypothetical protein